MTKHLLEVSDLSVIFHTVSGDVRAVNKVNWHLDKGETLAILGESGSGKSVSASAIVDLIDMPPGEVTSGEIWFKGNNLLAMPPSKRREINGKNIAVIFQDPLSHLNPVYTVGWQIEDIYQNLSITFISSVKINQNINDKIFELPKKDD